MVMESGSASHSQMLKALDLTLMKANTTLTKNMARAFLSGSLAMYTLAPIMKTTETDLAV